MKGFNQIQIIGNLGGEPEMRFTPAGKAVTNFSVATSRKFKTDAGELVEDTQWHKVITWSKLAEACNKTLNKGSAVFVTGRMTYRQWEKDGQKHNVAEIVASDVIFLDKPTANGSPVAEVGPEELSF